MQSGNSSSPQMSANESLKAQLGPEISRQLIFDYSNKVKDPVRRTQQTLGSSRNSVESSITNEDLSSSISDTSITSNQESPSTPKMTNSKLNKSPLELDAER